jgi:thymidylate synthase (FAD)
VRVLDHGFVELVSHTGNPQMVVDTARCSYGSKGTSEDDRRLVRYLLGNGHTSPFRHYFFTFHVKAPLFTFRQWWKYQVGSTWREYEVEVDPQVRGLGKVAAFDIQIDTDQGCSWNELSGRYKVMEPEFYMPAEARRNTGRQSSNSAHELTNIMQDQLELGYLDAIARYNLMLDAGVAKELARLILPPAIYSECFWTVSLQAVLHFLEQRLKPDAQLEIRTYAGAVLDLIRPHLTAMGIDK